MAQIAVRLPKLQLEHLNLAAAQLGRNRSEIIRAALTVGLKRISEHPQIVPGLSG